MNTQPLLDLDIDKSEFKELSKDDVFINLKILSKLRNDEKLVVAEKLLNIDTSYLQFITRWYKSESRERTIDYISHVIEESFRICDSTINAEMNRVSDDPVFDEDNTELLQRLTNELSNCIDGLITIKITYRNDSLVQSRVDLLIENIRNKVQRNNRLLKLNV